MPQPSDRRPLSTSGLLIKQGERLPVRRDSLPGRGASAIGSTAAKRTDSRGTLSSVFVGISILDSQDDLVYTPAAIF